MKLVLLLLTACTVRVGPPFGAKPSPPPPANGEQAAGAEAPTVASKPAVASDNDDDNDDDDDRDHDDADRGAMPSGVVQQIVIEYNRILLIIDEQAQQPGATEEDLASEFHEIAKQAKRLREEIVRKHRDGPATVFPTRQGRLTEAMLLAKLDEMSTRYGQLGDQHAVRRDDALIDELHARSEEQRDFLRRHGRPRLIKVNGEACWYLRTGRAGGLRDTYCWTAEGKLASHIPPASGVSLMLVSASVLAAGNCERDDCLTNGWRKSLPDPHGWLQGKCTSRDCAHKGWTSTFSKDGSAVSQCERNDCLRYGWTTQLSDGTTTSVRCRESQCAKYGWDITLPSGETYTCMCTSDDCIGHPPYCD